MTVAGSVRVQALQKSFWDESRGEVRAVDGIDEQQHAVDRPRQDRPCLETGGQQQSRQIDE